MDYNTFYIIDDDSINNLVCENIINNYSHPHDVRTFMNAEDALDFFKDNDLNEKAIILLDINMPIMDGWAFLDRFVENQKWCNNSKVFMLSSSIDVSDITKSKSYECVADYIVKPLNREKIKTVIAKSTK